MLGPDVNFDGCGLFLATPFLLPCLMNWLLKMLLNDWLIGWLIFPAEGITSANERYNMVLVLG